MASIFLLGVVAELTPVRSGKLTLILGAYSTRAPTEGAGVQRLGIYDDKPVLDVAFGGSGGMLNVLRHESRALTAALRAARCRHASTAFVPPASVAFTDRRLPPPPKTKPESPNTYTGRSGFYDAVDDLEKAIQFTRNALKNLQLLPLPKFALQALPPHQPVWKNKRIIGDIIGTTMTPSRYARIRSLLEQLDEYKRIATVAGYGNLADTIANVLELFEREDKAAYLARGQSKPVPIDELGRSYAVGRRKESAARVWVIPVKLPEAPAAAPVVQGEASLATAGEGPLSNLPGSVPLTPAFNKEPTPVVPTSQILINNTPLVEYLYVPIHSFLKLELTYISQPYTS